MKLTPTILSGCFILEPHVLHDERGYFFESFNQKRFSELTATETVFVQDNQSFSTKGVLRGLHYQTGEHAQAKLVRAVSGEILDVVVDIRQESPTYGKWISVILTEDNQKQLFIPRGFAHGFLVLSNTAIFAYKCDNFYNKESEAGILYNDPFLAIDWQTEENLLVSEKDMDLPTFEKSAKIW